MTLKVKILPQNRISGLWAKHIDDAEKREEFKKTILASNTALDRLRELIDEMLEELDMKSMDFDTKNWAYFQASLIGEKRILNKLRRLITFD